MSDTPECQHDWALLKIEKRIKPGIGFCWFVPPTITVAVFYCRKCLQYQEKHDDT